MAPLNSIIDADAFDNLPEDIKEHYAQDGDNYVLQTDSNDKIDEFRNNNRTLYRENEELKKRQAEFEKQLAESQKEVQQRTEKELLNEGKIDELLDKRTEAMRQSYEEKINQLAQQYQAAEQTLDIHIVENQIRDAAIKAHARNDRAVDHIIRAIKPQLKRDGTSAVRVDGQGNAVMGSDGKTPQGIPDLVEELRASDSFLFAESTGSGANGGQNATQNGKKRIRRSEIGKYITEVAKGEVEIVDG
ncbi:MAG: hypothetical protein VW333_10760 [Pseudomonadales bacterium]